MNLRLNENLNYLKEVHNPTFYCFFLIILFLEALSARFPAKKLEHSGVAIDPEDLPEDVTDFL